MKEPVQIYEGADACGRCLGWKMVDNGEMQSWKHWAELPQRSAVAIQLGLVRPIECPDCKGTGREPRS